VKYDQAPAVTYHCVPKIDIQVNVLKH